MFGIDACDIVIYLCCYLSILQSQYLVCCMYVCYSTVHVQAFVYLRLDNGSRSAKLIFSNTGVLFVTLKAK
jgi:hypothetical protein